MKNDQARSPWATRAKHMLASMLVLLTACGGGGGGGSDGAVPGPSDPGVPGASYFSFAVGDRWRSRDGNVTYSTRVTRQDGAALVLRQEGDDGSVEEFALERSDGGVALVPAASADALTAAIGRYDIARFPLRAGTSYTALDRTIGGFDLDGDGRADNLQVRIQVTVIGFERITVPAGTFDNALRQRTVITQTAVLSGSARTVTITGAAEDWYASGIGPVRTLLVIEGSGSRETSEELLVDYRVDALSSDTVAPNVSSRSPAPDSLGADVSVQLVFSEAIERSTLPNDALTVRTASGTPIPGRSQWQDARTLAFIPEGFGALVTGRYSVTLNGTPEDWAGNRLAGPVQWSFDLDRSGPVLVARSPADRVDDVAPGATLSFTFDEEIAPTAATSTLVQLFSPAGLLPSTVRVDGRVLTITPSFPLERGQFHTFTIGPVPDVLGNLSAFGVAGSFTVDPGRFELPRRLPAFEGRRVPASTLADVDGDGRADLVAIDQELSGGFGGTSRLLRRSPGGRLADSGLALPGLACAGRVQVVDIDADGRADVLSTAPFCGMQWVGQEPGGGWAFRATIASNVLEAKPVVIVGLPRPALALIDDSRHIRLLRPTSGSAFGAPQTLYAGAEIARDLQVIDIDGDGRSDLLAQLVIGGNSQLWIARQRADGTFDTELLATPGRSLLLAAELSGDGRVDLLLQTASPSTELMLLRQGADGSFAADSGTLVLPGRASNRLALADLDGDGRQDLTLPILDSSFRIVNFVLIARRGDGSLGFTSLLDYALVDPLVEGDLHVADFSGDGRPDLLLGGLLIRGRSAIAAPSGWAAGSPLRRLGQAATSAARLERR